jgi:hypothetical protein
LFSLLNEPNLCSGNYSLNKDFLTSRVGAVALYTVLWAELLKYWKWSFSASHRIKTLEPINTKIYKIDYVIESPSLPDRDRSSGRVSHMDEVFGDRYFFKILFL